ncbi:hypothetical protein D8674_020984 [Pyrus ussuriensis x Pyrus communis]|uniref:RNase H type-1 domain-containing protein n=1 Tax=Pyrus ussuriensis x Pyrus communis TaxID=2448454 RepID=A0A5N5HH82_9ROSA|nr:hypothetical protein D8674_020984 [Pyrus ussuriensis x Pyrus communis]
MPLTVEELIDFKVRAWKMDVVRTCFDKDEGDIIPGLHVSLAGCRDRIIWHYSVNGVYSVQTRYGVAMEMQANGEPGRKGTAGGRGRLAFGVLKINCDGAWCGKTCKGGYGWVVRDFAGMLLAAGGVGGLLFSSAAMVEAAAIRAAVESDSQMLVRMINGEYGIDATLECFIYDISPLVFQLGRVRFLFVKRDGNVNVHIVASYDVLSLEFLFNILVDIEISVKQMFTNALKF